MSNTTDEFITKAISNGRAMLSLAPHLLRLDELHRGMAVWLEDIDKQDLILAIGGSSAGGAKCFITEDDRSIAPLDEDYGIRWRAWSRKPTEEQRKVVKWNEIYA